MGDQSQAFHLIEVFLDLWAKGNGEFITGWKSWQSDCVFARESTNSCEPIWKLHQVISGSDGLGCCMGCSRLDHCLLLLWEQVQGLEVLCQVGWLWWHNSSSQLLTFHMLEALGWQDQGCLQHTSKSLPCGVEHQGSLAAKWWGHRMCHSGIWDLL